MRSTQIIPGLWIGPWPTSDDLEHADIVVNLYGGIDFPSPKCVVWAIHDGPLPDLWCLHALGRMIADAVRAGQRVLVHCQKGFNRSALVCGVALTYLGFNGPDAIAKIREVRGPWALVNPIFRSYLNRPAASDPDPTHAAIPAAEHYRRAPYSVPL